MSEVGGTRLEVGLMLSLTVLGVGSRAELAAQFHDTNPPAASHGIRNDALCIIEGSGAVATGMRPR